MLGLIRKAFWSPEVGGSALDVLTIYLAHAGLGALLCWSLAAALDRLRAGKPRVLALSVVAVGYAGWEGAQIAYAGGGIADGAADWVGVVGLAAASVAAFDRQWSAAALAAWLFLAGAGWSLAQFMGA